MKVFFSPVLVILTIAYWAGRHTVKAQCEVPGDELDKCLDKYLTEAEELACNNCIDTAGITLAAGECNNPAFCAAMEACATDCGAAAVPCFGLMPAKFVCELNDERTTEPPLLPACPSFSCTNEDENVTALATNAPSEFPGTTTDSRLSENSAAVITTGSIFGLSLFLLLVGTLI